MRIGYTYKIVVLLYLHLAFSASASDSTKKRAEKGTVVDNAENFNFVPEELQINTYDSKNAPKRNLKREELRIGMVPGNEKDSFPPIGDNINDLILSPRPVQYYSSSSSFSSNYLNIFAFDGRKSSLKGLYYWMSARNDEQPQWLMVDLKKSMPLVKFIIYWKKGSASRNFSVQYSQDKQSWYDIAAHLDSAKQNQTIITLKKALEARFIRIFQPGGSDAAENKRKSIAIFEFEIFLENNNKESLFNLAPFAQITSFPYSGYSLKYLNDENTDTAMSLGYNNGKTATITISFTKVVEVESFAYLRSPGVTCVYSFNLDCDGDSVYEIKGSERDDHAIGWNEVVYKHPVKVKNIQMMFTPKGKHGWWVGYPYLLELKILSSANPFLGVKKKDQIMSEKDKLLFGEKIIIKKSKNTVLKGAWLNCFNIGITPRHETVNLNLAKTVLDNCEKMGLNHLMLEANMTFRPGEKFYRVAWPSKILKGIESDSLREFVKMAHKRGMKVSIMSHRKVEVDPKGKYKVNSYSYKDMGSKLSGGIYKNMWKDIIKEILDLGCDGVSLLFDEGKTGARYYRAMNDNDPTIKEFKAKWGYEKPPAKQENTPKCRRYILFSYSRFGTLYADLAEFAESIKPDVFTVCNIQKSCIIQNARLKMNMAYDIIGNEADVGYWGTVVGPFRYYAKTDGFLFPVYASKVYSAMNKKGYCGAIFSNGYYFPWNYKTPYPSSYFTGSSLASLFNGARSLLYYRYNYLFSPWQGVELWDELRKTSSMVDMLSTLGLTEATPPRIAVIKSRASEDWWQMAHKNDPNRAYVYNKAIVDMLMTEGYPFDILSAERIDHLEKIINYDVVIHPFPYAVSDGLVEKLEVFASSGKRLMIFGRQEGMVNEFGDKRDKPALKNLFALHAYNSPADLSRIANTRRFIKKTCKWLDYCLGVQKTWTFNKPSSKDVYFTFNRKNDREAFILLVNYENKQITVNVGMDMPKGNYVVKGITEGEAFNMKFKEPSQINADKLKSFDIELKANQPLVVYLKQSKK